MATIVGEHEVPPEPGRRLPRVATARPCRLPGAAFTTTGGAVATTRREAGPRTESVVFRAGAGGASSPKPAPQNPQE